MYTPSQVPSLLLHMHDSDKMSLAFTEREVRPEDQIDPKILEQIVGRVDDATIGKDTDQTPFLKQHRCAKK